MKRVNKKQVKAIVIDGMATLYRLELGEAKNDGVKEINNKVAEDMRILSEISRKQKIPVIITNQVYSDFLTEKEVKEGKERKTNFVGGDLFKYWSKCIIELKNDNKKRKAILIKHRSMPQKEISFEIRDGGIFKKGWIRKV